MSDCVAEYFLSVEKMCTTYINVWKHKSVAGQVSQISRKKGIFSICCLQERREKIHRSTFYGSPKHSRISLIKHIYQSSVPFLISTNENSHNCSITRCTLKTQHKKFNISCKENAFSS